MNSIPKSVGGQRAKWRAQGLCQTCGAAVDHPEKFVRCKACRDQRSEYTRMYNRLKQEIESGAPPALTPNQAYVRRRMQEEAQQAIAAEKFKRKIQKCKNCEWARIDGSIIFCPFMDGICQKGEYNHGNQSPDQGQRPANPV